jgi:hypothetical protein
MLTDTNVTLSGVEVLMILVINNNRFPHAI